MTLGSKQTDTNIHHGVDMSQQIHARGIDSLILTITVDVHNHSNRQTERHRPKHVASTDDQTAVRTRTLDG